ncbi:MAG: hypothetical protein HOP13_12380 [Alphaproteobacteria bacterium]|nr:hypothetical protein [Alphaproteobacteria bacterium]
MAAIVRKVWQYARLAVGGIMLLIAVASPLVPKSEQLVRHERLEAEGIRTVAKVTNLWVNDDKMSVVPLRGLGAMGRVGGAVIAGQRMDRALDGENPAKRDVLTKQVFHVAYAFQPDGKAAVEHRTTVNEAQFTRLAIDAPVEVLFHPRDPAIHRLLAYSKPRSPITAEMKLMGSLFGAVVGGLLMWGAWPRRDAAPSVQASSNAVQRVARITGSTSLAGSARPPQSTVQRTEFGRRT